VEKENREEREAEKERREEKRYMREKGGREVENPSSLPQRKEGETNPVRSVEAIACPETWTKEY
jgi:hypothetical protein